MEVSTIYRLALGEEAEPDHWQRALAAGKWPRVLIAPTGSGKTAAVTLGWALHRLSRPDVTPRRLVWCLPMRTLVEQTANAVTEWFRGLNDSGVNGSGALPRAEDVHVLMGGVESHGWIEVPERSSVVVGTQDMLLSRALMRGYASSRAVWPVEFALLHEDTQWVFDEVQLMGAGRATSAQLEAFRQCEAARATRENRPVGRPSRSLWISATLDPTWLKTVDHPIPHPSEIVRVDPSEDADIRLARLTRATKALYRFETVPNSSKSGEIKAYIDRLADSILASHRIGCMTLVIVNRVPRAQSIYAAIKKKARRLGPSMPKLALVHSRFRPDDRQREMIKINGPDRQGLIVVATQAVEAGVDISAAVMFTELAPWSSLVQRFGRLNRYAEYNESDPAKVYWIDVIGESGKDEKDALELARPYAVEELLAAREQLERMTDVAPVHLPSPEIDRTAHRVIRRKDILDLFDTDPDLTGFDVDVSPYVRDSNDTDIRVFWRDLRERYEAPPRPSAKELCAVPIGAATDWIKRVRQKQSSAFFVRDPQWRRVDGITDNLPPGWKRFTDAPWPGLTLLVDVKAGGYDDLVGFTGDPKHIPSLVIDDLTHLSLEEESEGHDEDPKSAVGRPVSLAIHLRHVAEDSNDLCRALDIDVDTRRAILRAARWHDLGKAHTVFQDTMRRGLGSSVGQNEELLAKTVEKGVRHSRDYFRHELASALAFLAHENWSCDANLTAYLIAAHHGKVRLNLRAFPREGRPNDCTGTETRFARGICDGDELPAVNLEGGEQWSGGLLDLSVMELGWNEVTHESWTERTRELLVQFGPFRLAWMESLLRIADWRASARENKGDSGGRQL